MNDCLLDAVYERNTSYVPTVMTSSNVVYRVSNKGLDGDGMFFSEKTDIEEDTSQPLFRHVLRSDNTASPENVATLQHCFKPLWVGMRILGMFPICCTQTGTAEFKSASGAFIYSVVLSVLVGAYTATIALNRVSYLRNSDGRFNELIFSYMCILYCVTYWCLPIGHWFAAKKVALYINSWSNFQAHTHKLTGVPLSFNTGQQILFWAFAVPVLCVSLVVCEFFMLQAFDYWEAFYCVIIDIIIYYHTVTWCYICSALSRAASHLKLTLAVFFASLYLQVLLYCTVLLWNCGAATYTELPEIGQTKMQSLELRAHPRDQSVVPKYRELWEELSCLTRATGNVLCYVYGSLKLILFTILTCALYGALCEGGQSHVTTKQIGLGLNSIAIFGGVFFVCNSAHLATETVGGGFLNHLKQLKCQVEEIQQQLEQFQKVVCLDPPSISLGGYVLINRELLISLLATIVTYLVVLLQFKAGEGKEPIGSLADNDSLTTFSP